MPPPHLPDPELVEKAVRLARLLQRRATVLQSPYDRERQEEIARMVQSPKDKATLMELTDQAFRSQSTRRIADQFQYILRRHGVPGFFSSLDRTLLRAFEVFGNLAPNVSVPLARMRVRKDAERVILPLEEKAFGARLQKRRETGIRMNVNLLGEALLGEAEAKRRLENYLLALRRTDLEVLSIKISTIYSQISPLAREHTLEVLCDRLERLYQEAATNTFTRADGSRVSKFVYLDMEEYRDMSLTAEAFMRTLDRRGLDRVRAGIALQAYLSDSLATQRTLYEWARRRVAGGGAPITIRLVKGANLEMERVDAALHGWPQAPFTSKADTDSNYKQMLHEALRTENVAAAHVGVASHNLFELAYGIVVSAALGAGDRVQFEMLEGMADQQRRALFEQSQSLLLYAPACRDEDFVNAIGYLIRRLDESTAPENFLTHAFNLQVGSPEWTFLEESFRKSFQASEYPPLSRRKQNRLIDSPITLSNQEDGDLGDLVTVPINYEGSPTLFSNEPDTDFSLPRNGRWATKLVHNWEAVRDGAALEIPLVIDGEEIFDGRHCPECRDPSRPYEVVGRFREANESDVQRALACARRDPDGWRNATPKERSATLARVAAELRRARSSLIGTAMANAGKTVAEADPEVSEAVDFAEFYPRAAEYFYALPGVEARPKGVAVVVPPWNFPIAIPSGGITAALAAGNTVILKPATPAVMVAWELCKCFWRAGVSKRVLQFIPCSGGGVATRLVTDPQVDAVILTGGTATALELLRTNLKIPLFAETGGKNAMIVTAMSDREQAIKHAIHSAFSHSGQKCSATSLLLLETEVYNDAHFREMLVDAAASLDVGPVWELHTRVGPLIRPPRTDLERALTTLEPGEVWALRPSQIGDNPHLWSPGIKYGVQPGSYTHRTEFFGPVLGVICVANLREAVEVANSTGYGLTSGLQSLDEREINYWRENIRAGNLYINKPTVGAIVLRQPFGGLAKSSFGPGMHAGGPNYVAQFIAIQDKEHPISARSQTLHPVLASVEKVYVDTVSDASEKDLQQLRNALQSYQRAWDEEFSREHDHFRLLGEDNIRRYLPVKELRLRITPADSPFEIAARVGAALLTGCKVRISVSPDISTINGNLAKALGHSHVAPIGVVSETDTELAELIRGGFDGRLRFAAPDRVSPVLQEAAASSGAWIAAVPITSEGRVELLWYLQEQSISHLYHRYGNLGARAGEPRMAVK